MPDAQLLPEVPSQLEAPKDLNNSMQLEGGEESSIQD